MTIRFGWRFVAAVLSMTACAAAGAAVKPASIFTDNAVLQQKQPVPVWGTADPNEPIEVIINGQSVKTVADATGAWSVKLKAIPAGGPYTLTINGTPSDTVTLNNILVGEVWICGGQSNMEYPMKGWVQPAFTKDAIPTSADPQLRYLSVAYTVGITPKSAVGGVWQVATVDTVPNLSAVGYFFARELRKSLGVPVGLINDNWGGTPAEAWTSREALETVPSLKRYLDEEASYPARFTKMMDDYNAKLEKYNADKAKFDADVATAKANATPVPTNAPQSPRKPATYETWPNGASHLYNGKLAPVIPYGIRGAIWYQGESNGGSGFEYKTLFPTMIADWRARFGQGNFPFLFVQLAPHMGMNTTPLPKTAGSWAELREAQRLTLQASPNTGMAVITDIGDVKDVHPRRKEQVGVRLALIAKATVYGDKKIEYSGPVLDKIKTEGSKVRVSFTHADGLKSIDVHDATDDGPQVAFANKLVGFEVAGDDGVYAAADAVIDGKTVVLSSPNVTAPVSVRYGWANYPIANLSNGAGLPASPFKTDNWPWGSEPKPQLAPAK
ncbi:MAG TPA: sialate O-acetylesterase [Capsulimonadaceae bacterium]|jgi:sialate O-acetylesterase